MHINAYSIIQRRLLKHMTNQPTISDVQLCSRRTMFQHRVMIHDTWGPKISEAMKSFGFNLTILFLPCEPVYLGLTLLACSTRIAVPQLLHIIAPRVQQPIVQQNNSNLCHKILHELYMLTLLGGKKSVLKKSHVESGVSNILQRSDSGLPEFFQRILKSCDQKLGNLSSSKHGEPMQCISIFRAGFFF